MIHTCQECIFKISILTQNLICTRSLLRCLVAIACRPPLLQLLNLIENYITPKNTRQIDGNSLVSAGGRKKLFSSVNL